jgi:hypothetical protein
MQSIYWFRCRFFPTGSFARRSGAGKLTAGRPTCAASQPEGNCERFAQLALGHNSRAIHEHNAAIDVATRPACWQMSWAAAGIPSWL